MRFIYLLLIVGIILVFYLSWVQDSDLIHVWFMPDWLASWTDKKANENIRTGVPFIFLGMFAGLLPTRTQRLMARWAIVWLILVGVVILAELGQLLLPDRVFSWEDIGWGALGSIIGLAVSAVIKKFRAG
ncbi:VanZ family protein [Spirosoma sp. KNUC1025]|uniref:VanZ family protein n=1 Tax=Spirosoma sp. KNUC1025 TaxID=2894082 RepID=UPI0038631C28|nr:VanZ family protein [Spirosoma sp. KNUC1025]